MPLSYQQPGLVLKLPGTGASDAAIHRKRINRCGFGRRHFRQLVWEVCAIASQSLFARAIT